nr:hypothetical protein [Cressdnaviricota sp.]
MPRPRLMKEYDIRVTPPLGQDLDFITDEFELFIACKEFGYINKKKHYHIYCKTTLNDNEVKKYLRLICDVRDSEDVGNKLYRVKDKHEGTIGYVIKEFNVVATKGFTEDQLSEFKRLSADYRKQKEAERKQKQRKNNHNSVEICNQIVDQIRLESFMQAGTTMKCSYRESSKEELAAVILQQILSHSKSEDEGLAPPRSTVERMIITIMLKLGKHDYVNEYYLPRCFQKSFFS